MQKALQLTSSRDIISTLTVPWPHVHRHRSPGLSLKDFIVKNLRERPGSLFTYVFPLNYSAAELGRLGPGADPSWGLTGGAVGQGPGGGVPRRLPASLLGSEWTAPFLIGARECEPSG